MRKLIPVAVISVVNAILAVVATYAVLRAYDVLFKREPNPATVIWSMHIAMFWRLGIGAYVAGAVAMITSIAARRDLASMTRITAALVPIVGAMIALQGSLLP